MCGFNLFSQAALVTRVSLSQLQLPGHVVLILWIAMWYIVGWSLFASPALQDVSAGNREEKEMG